MNRDLTKRVRTVPGLTQDKKVVRNDIKLAAKIMTNLDTKWNLWTTEDNKEDVSLGLMSANPLLANITDYLIEEANAEEEELLGKTDDTEEKDEGVTIQRDEELIKVLDKMILYLRIVHSVDFYNHSEYPNEDEMPNRCGILHARGNLPTGKTKSSEIEVSPEQRSVLTRITYYLCLPGVHLHIREEDGRLPGPQRRTHGRRGREAGPEERAGGGGEVHLGQHSGARQGQVVVSSLWQKVQGSGLCKEAHPDQTHGEDG